MAYLNPADKGLDSDSDGETELLALCNISLPVASKVTLVKSDVDSDPGPRSSNASAADSQTSSFFDKRQSIGSIISSPQRTITNGIDLRKLNSDTLATYVYPTNLPPRDYQMNIVQKALFHNLLCALPTGMGKTFIASTVMLNWYRWTLNTKIIFMAPTRPLVSQQIEACLGITGIPRKDACVMIGSGEKKEKRAELWRTKRVFFATPQIVEGDLKNGRLDPESIVCLVFDEAHRATGNYAYVEIVNFIYRFQESCRILALTATPSGRMEGVQDIINNLKISRTEIRTEESLDVRQYVHKRKTVKIRTEPSKDEKIIIENLAQAVKPLLVEANKLGAYHVREVEKITQFGALQALQKFNSSPAGRNQGISFKVRSIMSLLIKIGQAINLLKVHGIIPFYNCLNEMKKEEESKNTSKNKKKTNKENLLLHDGFKNCMEHCEDLIYDSNTGRPRDEFIGHEKLNHIIYIVNTFFFKNPKSRGIIFTEFRDSAAEIERVLDYHCFIRAKPHLFIGQSSSEKKKGENKETGTTIKTGMKQKDQQKVVEKFKVGEYNLLIATSIGEEGLDIGEVDLIICYDQSKSPIRVIQRMGRTGRKRDGHIYLLMTGEEEKKVDQSFGGYHYIQEQMNKQEKLTYFENNRILPPSIRPTCEQKLIEIPDENKELLIAKEKAKDIVEALKVIDKPSRKRKHTTPSKCIPDTVHAGTLQLGILDVTDESENEFADIPSDYTLFGHHFGSAHTRDSEDKVHSERRQDETEISAPPQEAKVNDCVSVDDTEDNYDDEITLISSQDYSANIALTTQRPREGIPSSSLGDISPNEKNKLKSYDHVRMRVDDEVISSDNFNDITLISSQQQYHNLEPSSGTLVNSSPYEGNAKLKHFLDKTFGHSKEHKLEHEKLEVIVDALISTENQIARQLSNVPSDVDLDDASLKDPLMRDSTVPSGSEIYTSEKPYPNSSPHPSTRTSIISSSPTPLVAKKTSSHNENRNVTSLRNFFNLKQTSPPLSTINTTAASTASCELTEGFLTEEQNEIFNSLYKIDNPPYGVEYDPLIGARTSAPYVFIPHSTTFNLFHTTIQKMRTSSSSYLKRLSSSNESNPPKRQKNN